MTNSMKLNQLFNAVEFYKWWILLEWKIFVFNSQVETPLCSAERFDEVKDKFEKHSKKLNGGNTKLEEE